MQLARGYPGTIPSMLYPMMVIAAVAVIVFSILGIASMTGWMPHAILGSGTSISAPQSVMSLDRSDGSIPEARPAFPCVECGLIESVRDIERRGSLLSEPIFAALPDNPSSQAAGI